MSSTPSDIQTGGVSAWQLPSDATCAAIARATLTSVMRRLALPEDLIADSVTAVSELATNAYQHGVGEQNALMLPAPMVPTTPELWAYVRAVPEAQLIIKVFDCHRQWTPGTEHDDTLDEHGRGLPIVEAYTTAWGIDLARSRLAPTPARGKSVWFAQAIPPGLRGVRRPQLTVPQAAHHLNAELTARGIEGVYRNDEQGVSLVSVCRDLSVWIKPDGFRWTDADDVEIHRSLYDLADTIEQVVRRHEELDLTPAHQNRGPTAVTSSEQ